MNTVEEIWQWVAENDVVLDPDGSVNDHFIECAAQADDLDAGLALWKNDLFVLDRAVQGPMDRAAESIARKLREDVTR